MKIEKIINLLETMLERLYEVDSDACVSLIKPHIVESQAFLIKLQEAIDKLDPTEIVDTSRKFLSDMWNCSLEGLNGKSYWQRNLNNYSYVICEDPDDSNAITISVYLKGTDADNPALCEDSKEYKDAMALYDIADKLSMFKPLWK